MPLLDVRNLKMYYRTREGQVHAVDDISFSLEKGQAIGIAGESGSGKTSIALALLRLLPSNGAIEGGSIYLDGESMIGMPEDMFRKEVRWKRISIVPQAAMNALNPVFRVSDQVGEAILTHTRADAQSAEKRTKELLEEVGISPSRSGSFPHEFSGGMKQRTMIAMALALNPDILIADEPTSALDVIVQAQLLLLLKQLQKSKHMAIILITHDLSLVAEMCDAVMVYYAGQIVEYARSEKIFHNPKHPYTIGLIKAFPNIEAKKTRLSSIPGSPPDLIHIPQGCRFAKRCQFATEWCSSEMPPLIQVEPDHASRCWYYWGM